MVSFLAMDTNHDGVVRIHYDEAIYNASCTFRYPRRFPEKSWKYLIRFTAIMHIKVAAELGEGKKVDITQQW